MRRFPVAVVVAASVFAVALPMLGAPKKTKKKPPTKPMPTIVPATPTTSSAPPSPTSPHESASTPTKPKSESVGEPASESKTEATSESKSGATSEAGSDADAPEVHVELAACPSSAKTKDLDGRELKRWLEKSCRSLAGGGDLSTDDLLVVACVRGGEAKPLASCGLKATLEVPTSDGAPKVLQLVAEGESALTLKTERVEKAASPPNGTPLTAVVEAEGQPPTRTLLAWHRGNEGYARGRWLWFPSPMLTTDLSSSPQGYRLGITPLAVAGGAKIFLSSSSRSYLGVSGFLAWNLLVPNDTQTLSNGTQVRINFKGFGGGALFDASGWIALGVGVGHTFTSDARTDLRFWIYFGPRLLGFLGV